MVNWKGFSELFPTCVAAAQQACPRAGHHRDHQHHGRSSRCKCGWRRTRGLRRVDQRPGWKGLMNKATGLTLFAAAFVLVLFWLAFRRARLMPRGLQNFAESVYDFIDTQISRDVIGERGRKYTPYFVVLFSFVLVCNVLAIVPGAQFPATSRIAVPAILSAITFVIFNYAGIKTHGAGPYFKEMLRPPGVPVWLLPLLSPIELMSTLIVRPFTLAVRLFANMFAGHLLLLVFSLGTAYLLPKPPYVFGLASLLMTI